MFHHQIQKTTKTLPFNYIHLIILVIAPFGTQTVHRDKKYRINNYELKRLLKLSEQTNRVVPKNEIIPYVWFDNQYFKSKELSLNNLICNLRKIFNETDKRISIDTIRGHGYKLNVR